MKKISLATLWFANEYAFAWKLLPRGQVSCEPPSKCLLQTPQSVPAGMEHEMTPSRAINTWYPIPKWKVFFDRQKNRNGWFSQPYFNKQDTGRTDGNIRDNDFSSSTRYLKERIQGLNIQFLPLKDGNITVEGFGGEERINGSSEEYVALFVVYAHSINKYIPKIQSDSNKQNATEETEMGLVKEKVNNTSCDDDPGGCLKNGPKNVKQMIKSNETDSKASPKGEKIVLIPMTKNMSIVMNVGELDNDNYTVMIIPLNKTMNAAEIADKNGNVDESDSVNVTLTKNMSMVVKSDEITFNEQNTNVSLKVNASNMKDVSKKLPEDRSLHSYKNETDFNSLSTDITDIENETATSGDISSNTLKNKSIEFSTVPLLSNSISDFTDSNYLEADGRKLNNSVSDKIITKEEYKNNSLKHSNDEMFQNASTNEQFSRLFNESNKNMNRKKSGYDSYEIEYHEQLGPFEVKELNSSHPPFIARIHITVNNRNIRNKTTYMMQVSSQEINNADITKTNLTNNHPANTKEIPLELHRGERSTSNEYLPTWEKLHHRANNAKAEIINNKFASTESQVSNKYISRETKMILSKTNGTASAGENMSHFDLILPGDIRKEEANFSGSFLFQKGSESYSSPTISSSNEEFNQKIQDKFRNKGIIANEISGNTVGDDGAKSNQTAQGDRNKREVAPATLIPNKDPGENHSVPKKSELQIVERGGSLERHLKMKIPPGMQSLRRNGIKVGKRCHVESGCEEMNDVFNTTSESGYHKVDEERAGRFDSNESLGANKRIDKKNRVHNLDSLKNIRDESINLVVNKGSDEKFQVKLIPIPLRTWYDLRFLRGMKDSIVPRRNVRTISRMKKSEGEMNNKSEAKEKDNSRVRFSKIANDEKNENLKKTQTDVLRTVFDQKLPKISKRLKSKEAISDPRSFNYFPKASKVPQMLSRKKRFTSGFIPLENNRNKLQTRNTTPNQMHPSQSENFGAEKFSIAPKYDEKSDETDWQNLIWHLLHANVGSNVSISSLNNFNSNKRHDWEPRDISDWKSKSEIAKWYSDHEQTQNKSPHKLAFDYIWIMVPPELPEHLKGKTADREPQTSTFAHKTDEPRKMLDSSDREREYEWDADDWILFNPMREQDQRKISTTPRSSTDQTPFHIINKPSPAYRTTKMPTRKAVFQTTASPTIRPNFYTTHRSTFRTTAKAWFHDKPWDYSPWSISHNPWENQWTTSRMTMGGMAGGD